MALLQSSDRLFHSLGSLVWLSRWEEGRSHLVNLIVLNLTQGIWSTLLIVDHGLTVDSHLIGKQVPLSGRVRWQLGPSRHFELLDT